MNGKRGSILYFLSFILASRGIEPRNRTAYVCLILQIFFSTYIFYTVRISAHCMESLAIIFWDFITIHAEKVCGGLQISVSITVFNAAFEFFTIYNNCCGVVCVAIRLLKPSFSKNFQFINLFHNLVPFRRLCYNRLTFLF